MRFEITVMAVDVDPQGEFLGVAFRVKLRGIDVLSHAKHLYRAITAGQQQGGSRGRGVDGFLVAKQHIDMRGETVK